MIVDLIKAFGGGVCRMLPYQYIVLCNADGFLLLTSCRHDNHRDLELVRCINISTEISLIRSNVKAML